MKNLTLPNLLTSLRLLAAPFLALLLLREAEGPALAVFVFAGASDAADGWLARHFDWASELGRVLDPAADKLLMLAAFVGLAASGAAPLWLAALVIGRDAVLVLGTLTGWFLRLPFKVAPLPIGKAATVLQVVYVALALVHLAFAVVPPPALALLGLAVALATLAAGLIYAGLWLKALAQMQRMA